MPYIRQETRQWIEDLLPKDLLFDEGDLNYFITRLLQLQNPSRYQDYNALIGVLECVKQEFYRRAVAAYEDEKIEENGDVYDLKT